MTDSTTRQLAADRLRADPRIAQAIDVLRSALEQAQQAIQGPRPPDAGLQRVAADWLERLAAARGARTYYPYLTSGIGNGPWVELIDGSVKLDFICGIGVHGLGHSHPRLLEAGVRAALEDTVMQGNLQQHPSTVHVMERLLQVARQSGAGLEHCMLTTSGAMANENALKIAFHNRHPADRIVALEHCFAGRSLATAQLTDRPQYRVGLPTTLAVDYLPPEGPEPREERRREAVQVLDRLLRRYPGKHAALWLELVSGEGGYYPGSREYFIPLIERAKEDGLLVIFDEVQTFGRLSRPFAFQHFGLDDYADIVTIGKITQLCATLYRGELKPTAPILSQTFTASSSAIEACLVMLDELERAGCYGETGQNMRRHAHFAAGLQRLSEKHAGKIRGPFGAGMMVAFTPGDGSPEAAGALVHRLYEAGLMGFVAGSEPARIRFLPPPGVTTLEHIDTALEIIDQVLSTWEPETAG